MENTVQNKQIEAVKQVQRFVSNPQVYLNAERGVLTHRLSSDIRIEMPVNLYKKILGIPFKKKEPALLSEGIGTRRSVFGLIARPVIYLELVRS